MIEGGMIRLSKLKFIKLIIKSGYRLLKPLLDRIISIIGLIIVSPVIFAVGLIIKLTSPGPVFYTQERAGKNDRLFKIIKFRTMRIDAVSQGGPVWAKKNDSRITTFGKFLRKTHIIV